MNDSASAWPFMFFVVCLVQTIQRIRADSSFWWVADRLDLTREKKGCERDNGSKKLVWVAGLRGRCQRLGEQRMPDYSSLDEANRYHWASDGSTTTSRDGVGPATCRDAQCPGRAQRVATRIGLTSWERSKGRACRDPSTGH